MLAPKNNVVTMRQEILTAVAECFWQNDYHNIDELPKKLITNPLRRKSVEQEYAVIKAQCLAAMGYTPEDEDLSLPLKDFAERALQRTEPLPAKVSVIKQACNACAKLKYQVSNMCQACYARPCEVNCPKKAISVNEAAFINQELCIKCGICYNNCPYQAIHKAVVPCEDACPVGAIDKDENGVEHINQDKCISCGKCLQSCPFGAVVYNSQIVDVLNALHKKDKKTVAMLAPAVIGQFGNDIGKVVAAFKKLGFDEVVEVAQGADVTTATEAAEFVERMAEGEKFMTTSCCPAWVAATEKHLPEIKPYVSASGSPMYYIAEIVKKRNPDCHAVFVGPCLAKRIEAERNPNVDNVLVFEEVQALFAAADINVATLPSEPFAVTASAQGRRYPVSGGVAGAVAHMVGDKAEYKAERIDGLSPETIKKLKSYAVNPPADINMIEVMCCQGGCVGGPGAICPAKRAAVMVENYVKTSPEQER